MLDYDIFMNVPRLNGRDIKTVQKLYREGALRRAPDGGAASAADAPGATRRHLETTLRDLDHARTRLQAAMDRQA